MSKVRVIAETGGPARRRDGNGMRIVWFAWLIYMREDVRRQALNVFRMRLLGAEVRTVTADTRAQGRYQRGATRLGDERPRYVLPAWQCAWTTTGSVMVREFQSVIGREAREQILSATGKLRVRWLCVGGGSMRLACSSVHRR